MVQHVTTLAVALFFLCLFVGNTFQAYAKIGGAPLNPHLYAVSLNTEPSQPQDDKSVLSSKNIRIINLGPLVNYSGLDYAPTISADGKTLYFVSDRVGSKVSDGNPSHDFWVAKKEDNYDTVFFKPYNLDTAANSGVNTRLNEGVASISADERFIYFTGCGRPDGQGDCDIYVAEYKDGKWGQPRNLGKAVNSTAWDSQPSISPDGKRLYFASNRDGGVGDIDIWYSDYDDEFDEWKPAINAGKIVNTSERDWTPFIGGDGVTLFFSSNGQRNSIGGLDFYITTVAEGGWSAPRNLGAPINTEEDDFFISIPVSGDVVYFASTRTDIKGSQGNYDIYMAFVPSLFRASILTVKVLDECSNDPIPAKVFITNSLVNKTYSDSVNTRDRLIAQHVITNAEYGNPKDSIKEVTFEVVAENPKYGKVSKKITVQKPKPVTSTEEAEKAVELETVILRLGQRPVVKANASLVMEKIITVSLDPLLNYVFFDEGSSVIPARYNMLKGLQNDINMDEKLRGTTLQKYYDVMNIYGARMRRYPDAKLEVVGCNSQKGDTEKRPNLSKERAQNVYNYLRDVWGIPESRMKLTFRDLPKTPSNQKDPDGIVENRRVELICETWEVARPIIDKEPTVVPLPAQVQLSFDFGLEEEIIKSRRLEITRGGKPWRTIQLSPENMVNNTLTWDWKNTEGSYPTDNTPYIMVLVVESNSGVECRSEPLTVNVTQKEKVRDKTQEKYNLILFPFDSYNTGSLNDRILSEYVIPRSYPSSEVEIVGHTDIVGLESHNKRLSENRARSAEKGITSAKKVKSIATSGVGEDSPLYPNDIPEGRFYNRTVQIVIQTPVEDIKQD